MMMDPPTDPFLTGWPAALITCGYFAFLLVAMVATFAAIWWVVRRHNRSRQEWVDRAIPGKARVIDIEQTGAFVNYDPMATLRLEVLPNVGEPYETRIDAVIATVHVGSYQPGNVVGVLIDPDNKWNVTLEMR